VGQPTLSPWRSGCQTGGVSIGRFVSDGAFDNVAYVAELLDPALTWDAIAWLRSITHLPLLVKGIVRADDAVRAVERGAAGVVVSNHGGRQLDASPATIEVLPRIADAVAGRGELLLDGGVRRGADVLKAVASAPGRCSSGAPSCGAWPRAAAPGVAAALATLRRELDLAMALCGCPDLASATRDLVEP
jgi:4-hydroxymandelate oxidase